MNRTNGVLKMANDHLTHHLSEEQMYALLDQPSAAGEAQRHLADCEQCAGEFAAIRQSLDGFKLAATGLAEAKFSPMLQVRGGVLSGMRRGLFAWPMGLAAAGVLLAGWVTMAHRPGPSVPVTTANVAAAPNESDEALLESVNQDLSTSVPPSLEPLSISSADGAETLSKQN